ncbi:MAG: glycosyltransferase [Ignavibacteriae bacterium]|nr:glycosyltransferase [Ignavibacteriota bacterium]
MKKILQIVTEGNFGSTGRIAEQIGIQITKNKWASYIAIGRRIRKSESKIIKIGNNIDILNHVVITRLFDRHGLGSNFATKKLIQTIDKIKPDIIHLHHLHGYYINIKILFEYLKKSKIPVVWTFHDCWSFTGHCAYYDFIGCDKWKTECNNCPQKKTYPSSFLFDRSKKNYYLKKYLFNSVKSLYLVAVSKWLELEVKQSFLKKNQIKVIYNGINLDIFKPLDSHQTRLKYDIINKFLILGVASPWSKRKGLEDFIKLSEFIDNDMTIILVGLSKKQISKLPKHIIGISRTEDLNELCKLYSAADVFINPTLEDNFPTTNLEALACGTPVITYKTGGSVEAINENTGIVVDKGDINGLLRSVKKIQQNGKTFYQTNCRKRAVENFNSEDRYLDYIKLYERLLSK